MNHMNSMIRVGSNRIVALRYVMKNSAGSIVAQTHNEPIKFLYGSGEILPALESALAGLKIGDQKSFSVGAETSPGLNDTFYFDVSIEDIRWREEGTSAEAAPISRTGTDCGPECAC